MGKIRVNNNGSSMDQGAIESTQNNAQAGGKKVLSVGPSLQKQLIAGVPNAFVSGMDASAGVSVTPWSSLWLYNNNSTVAWVALSNAIIASAPSSFANGIPLAPNTWTQLAAGDNSFIRTSGSTVGVYSIYDDTKVKDSNA